MTITATVIKDSISPAGKRLTTLELRYPRLIHSEFMTHRMFSRNASSSRAIPVEKIIADIERDVAMPVEWGKNEPGMQARQVLPEEHAREMEYHWREACADATMRARKMVKLGAHKQIINRILEPFVHINVIVTATDWTNFFQLRDHADADPTIRDLARAIRAAMDGSRPRTVPFDSWHLPYVENTDVDAVSAAYAVESMASGRPGDFLFEKLLMVSAARCARVSYKTHDGRTPDPQADIALADKLASSGHWSPFEHQAKTLKGGQYYANFDGWLSYRLILSNRLAAEDRAKQAADQWSRIITALTGRH